MLGYKSEHRRIEGTFAIEVRNAFKRAVDKCPDARELDAIRRECKAVRISKTNGL